MNKKIFIITLFIFIFLITSAKETRAALSKVAARQLADNIANNVAPTWEEYVQQAKACLETARNAARNVADPTFEENERLNQIINATQEAVDAAENIKRTIYFAQSAAYDAFKLRDIPTDERVISPELIIKWIKEADEKTQKAIELMDASIEEGKKIIQGAQEVFFVDTYQEAQGIYKEIYLRNETFLRDNLTETSYYAKENKESYYMALGTSFLLPPDNNENENGSGSGFTPILRLPGMPKNPTLGEYIYSLYLFAYSIAGILVVVVLAVAGVIYISSGGNPNRMATAKGMIISALTGLVLLFCSYLILRIINPDLLRKDLPELSPPGAIENP